MYEYVFDSSNNPPPDVLERDAVAFRCLFVPATIIDHSHVVDFFRGYDAPAAEAQTAARYAMTLSQLWGTQKHGLYATVAPLESDSAHGFLAAMRTLIPEAWDVEKGIPTHS